ncbi:hypothetical protein EZV62_017563 [Acer yangbiense]|uniref:Pectate lyase superfamily protein domain-containing protein n=1 Tax=Acer yangbiense TaxID=1000413 RepID=A0A5C7HGP6_9ROSI|nr:hypothetical protein EZV62_017563 [Acer yangbiense]
MKRKERSSIVLVLVFVLIVSVTFSLMSVEARKHHHKKSNSHHKHRKDHKGGSDSSGPTLGPAPAPLPPYGSYPPQTSMTVFNVLSFGAKGDGVTDDSKALLSAWKAACKVSAATLEIPSDFKFLIKPITLQGPCMPHLVLQKKSKHIPDIKPTALRFYASYNVTVRDIKIINSPQCHLKFDSSNGVQVNNIQISSPENSPNTDGIHLQNTQNVEIQHSNIGCGDDCVSIQTGCSNVHVHHINCGPGHGISLGGLGKDKSVACVSDIVVEKISIQNTLAGVRIKTWQGGIGSVKNVSFSNIQVSDVKVPIIIDQYYCDKHLCKNQTGAVAISGVKYDQIIGTYSVQPIHLACSNDIPCTDVDLIDIQLKPSSGNRYFQKALCWNSFGKSQAPLVPSSIDYCLRSDVSGSVLRRIARSHEHVC